MFVTAKTLIIAKSTFMWSLAYFLWTNPKVIVDNNYVHLIGQAMQLVSIEMTQALRRGWGDDTSDYSHELFFG